MKMKRLLALVLALVMLLPMLISCAKGGKGGNNDGDGERTESGTIVPEDVTFPGETFTVLCRQDNAWTTVEHEIMADEGETELVNQAVYERNLEVEERFDITIEGYAIPGQWDVYDDFVNTFRNSILSASGSFDMIMSHQAYMSMNLALNDLYYNIHEVPYIKDNLSAPHYNQDIVNEMTVNDKLYFLLGDYSLTYWEFAYVLYFNKTIAENYNLEDLYQLVKDGKWTFDKMIEMSKGVWTDLNGDAWPGEEDCFGYISDTQNTTDALEAHFDVSITSRDENGDIVFDIDQGKMVNILEKMIEFKATDDVHFVATSSETPEDSHPADKIFSEGRALFYPEKLEKAKKFRGMETDFGIIPYPKWNEEQEAYLTHAQDGYSIGVIPVDAPNIEMCGAVIDVLSALSSEKVIPAYYDMALKDKYARDDASGEMLDIIREGFTCNFGYFYGQPLGCANFLRLLIGQNNSNFVSFYAINSKSYERKLNKLIEAYSEADE